MPEASKITLFRLCCPRFMQKADPNRVGVEKIIPILKGKTLKGPLDCNSNHVIYLSECKQCQYRIPYVASAKTKFSYRLNNYKSTHRKLRKKHVEKDLAIVIKKSELKQNCFTNTTVQKVTNVLKI